MSKGLPLLATVIAFLGLMACLVGCGEKKAAFQGDPDERDAEGLTLLMQAAREGDTSRLEILLKHGADLEAADSSGDTALVHAVESGSLPAIHHLLEEGASPKVKVSTGGSLLVRAFREKQLAATYLLMKAGARTRSQGAKGESLVQAAVEMGKITFLKDLLARGTHPRYDEGNGHGLLHVAFDQKQDQVLDFLLEKGLDPNLKNSKEDTLVHRCVAHGFHHLLPALKKNEADFNIPNAKGWLPVHMAIKAGDETMLRSLINVGARVDLLSNYQGESLSPLELALDDYRVSMARQLLEQKAPPCDEMYQAVKLGGERGLEVVNLLLEFDASVMPDREGEAPLTWAVREREYDIARSLLSAGAPQDRLGASGQKPFHIAVAQENLPMVELLLEYGADANEVFQAEPSEEFLKHVVSKGVVKWALKNSKEIRPLMIAADSGNALLAELLIKHKASSGKSARVGAHRFWPLSFAARRQDTALQQVLFQRGSERTKRWIKVDLSEQKAVLYKGEKTIFTTRISSGKKATPTPTGRYVISNKYREWKSTLYDDAEMPFFQRLSGGDFGFHYGILPGHPASHGCIRLPMSSAKKLFRLTRLGDYVEIVK